MLSCNYYKYLVGYARITCTFSNSISTSTMSHLPMQYSFFLTLQSMACHYAARYWCFTCRGMGSHFPGARLVVSENLSLFLGNVEQISVSLNHGRSQ
ncbi:hypothetical protein IF1G_05911 [Cordyceps javanica]|uniref:Uncharacterized protein n=1 Tax=Cordyceps javanica TaxID=43265 RepID=A0A545UZM7_9HYPO|nr:hypothetical protein IF1G_05911 [Cordyceps javanica]